MECIITFKMHGRKDDERNIKLMKMLENDGYSLDVNHSIMTEISTKMKIKKIKKYIKKVSNFENFGFVHIDF